MQIKDYFIRLYQYNDWANALYLALFEQTEDIPERIHQLMSHVLVAQKLWLTRIQGNPDLTLHIWQALPLEELRLLAAENTKNWLEYLQNAPEGEFERILSYENFLKKQYETPIADLIIHTANHATYHRAQYAPILRSLGIAPPNTDFVTYSRIMSGQG